MFRVVELSPTGEVLVSDGPERVAPPPEGVSRWVDLTAQDEAQLRLLRERFGFHPLAIEDCAHLDQRPKLEEYDGTLFLVTQGFSCAGDLDHLQLHELHTFLGDRFLVTVHQDAMQPLEEVWNRARSDSALLKRGVDFVYYRLADGIVDGTFPILDEVADAIETLEDRVFLRPTHDDLGRIFALKRHLVSMRKVLSPQRDVFALLAKRGVGGVERTAPYFRDVYDHLARIHESIETQRDLLGNALDAYLSAVSNRTNEIMKYLTVMSAVFLPLAFVVGFFGQNFQDMPFFPNWMHDPRLVWAMLATCVGTPLGMLGWFHHRGWL